MQKSYFGYSFFSNLQQVTSFLSVSVPHLQDRDNDIYLFLRAVGRSVATALSTSCNVAIIFPSLFFCSVTMKVHCSLFLYFKGVSLASQVFEHVVFLVES